MNATITFDKQVVLEQTDADKAKEAAKIKQSLDDIFKHKISTPVQVIGIYKLLQRYKNYTGEDYKITFEENTIV